MPIANALAAQIRIGKQMDASKTAPAGARYLCDVSQVSTGEGRRIVLEGLAPIGVFNLDGSFHAIDDTCTHGDASLCEGEVIDGALVECPFHQGCFDLRSGAAVVSPCILPVKTHPIVIIDGKVYLDPA
jgi:nitrite reductase/ring-hydroxylating ferredoxin subunit